MGERIDPLRMERTTLSSGLDLVLQSPPASARSFSISYVAPAGWGFEPPGAAGLAMVTAKLVVGRPGGRRREEMARTLDRLGASLSSTTAPESSELTLWGPEDSWHHLLEIFADSIFRPHFAPDEMNRALRQLRERQLRQKVQPDLRVEQEFLGGLYPPGHPYNSTGVGTARTAARISLDKIRRFHRDHYPAKGSVLVVTSRLPAQAVKRDLGPLFPEALLRPTPSLPSLPTKATRSNRQDITINGQSQVAIRIGSHSVPRSDPSYPELFLANEVLGGRPLLSRLFQRIREQHGLAYHASSDLEAMRWGGYWEATAGTDPATRDRVVGLMLEEIERLSSDLIPSAELTRIRESALGTLPLELDTTASAHELAVDVAYHGLPGDFYRSWPSRLRAIHPKEVRAAAETGISARQAVVVTVGPAAK